MSLQCCCAIIKRISELCRCIGTVLPVPDTNERALPYNFSQTGRYSIYSLGGMEGWVGCVLVVVNRDASKYMITTW